MEQMTAAKAAVANAIDDVHAAIARVRHAQEVDWVSVMAQRYREELYGAIQDLVRFRDLLEDMHRGLS